MSKGFARIGLRSAIVVMSTVLTVLVLAVAILPRSTSAADDHPMNVRGYVYNNSGHKVPNADVTVTMYNGATPGTSKNDISNSLGYFSVDFDPGQWATGNTVRVDVVYNSVPQGYNDTAVVNGVYMWTWENFTSPYEIPQLGNNTTGLLVTAGLVGIVAVVALVWIRKAK
jgi:hypothetical protein